MESYSVERELQREYDDLLYISKLLKYPNWDKEPLNITTKGIPGLMRFENELGNYANKIRNHWFNLAFEHSHQYYKSPDIKEAPITPNGTKLVYGYERCLSPRPLEDNIYTEASGWIGFTVLFSSAMSGLVSLLSSIKKFYREKSKINGCFIGGYFETYILLESLSSDWLNITKTSDEKSSIVRDVLPELDFMIIEPVKYNFGLRPLNMEIILDVITQKPEYKTLFLVVDTTLLGNSFKREDILNRLSGIPNIIFIELRSGLKLDQFGFEFSNVGIMSLYVSPEISKLVSGLQEFFTGFRAILGTGLSFYEVCLLDFDGFGKNTSYAEDVLKSNELLAKSAHFASHPLISDYLHPALWGKNETNSQAPFILLRPRNQDEQSCQNLVDFITNKLHKLGFDIPVSNSFGFRNLRLQSIKTLSNKPEYVVKIAAGKIRGVAFHYMIEILHELSQSNSLLS